MRTLLILTSLLLLAACKPEDYAVLDQAVGHDPLGNTPQVTLLATNSSVEAIVALPSSSVPPVVEASSSSVYVPPEPPKEPCEPGTHGFRLWDCVDGFKVYW